MSAVFSNFVPIIKVPIMAYKKVKTEGKGRCFLIALMIM